MKEFIGAAKVSSVHEEETGTIVFDYIDAPAGTDWTNLESVRRVAPFAYAAANGFYKMVHNSYDGKSEDVLSLEAPESIIAIAGLTCEIYMKCIIYNFAPEKANKRSTFSGKTARILRKEHSLETLYNNLPEGTFSYSDITDDQFVRNLRDISEVFTTYRYSFELVSYEIPYKFLIDFMESLHDYCENLGLASPQMIRYSGTY